MCWGWLEKLLFAGAVTGRWSKHMTFCRTLSRFPLDMISSVFGKAERRSHLGDFVSCIPPALPLLHKPALTADLSSSLDLESHIAADSESEVWFRAVTQQPEPASARDREPQIHQNTLMLKPDVTSAVQPAYLVAAVEPVSYHVTRHSGLSNITTSGQWVNILTE